MRMSLQGITTADKKTVEQRERGIQEFCAKDADNVFSFDRMRARVVSCYQGAGSGADAAAAAAAAAAASADLS
jgi:hypothetical protein